uniref:Tail-specific protease n=1 Tax=Stylophora pistillata TaxID=50429 RepID=A0A2B4R8S9_STYPI
MDHIKFLQKRETKKKDKEKNFHLSAFDTLEKKAREKILERFNERYKVLNKTTEDEWFAVFLNSITTVFDPHTTYFSPSEKNSFDTNISGKLEGIGAVLQSKGDYIKVVRLIAGGPAWKQGDLEANDLIIKVQQEGKEALDIMGMSINNVVKIIKGKKGTKVILTVQKLDKTYQEINITRDIIELEESFLKSCIVTNTNGKKYGYIYLPQFYINFKQKNSRSASSDMKKVLADFNEENVSGILLDLRHNGGGALQTAIDIAGFFIKKGAIVQVRHKKNQVETYKDPDPKMHWKKSLVIIVDAGSASASEILAAAMQDYGRALVMGTQTFGKGTVQNILDLNRYAPQYMGPLGALKFTIQKFYRVNGGSTQIKGVTPDIKYPDPYKYSEAYFKGRSRIDLRETVYDFPSQNVITKDNVNVQINALLYFQVMDPVKAVYEIENLPDAIEKLTQTTLRNVVGELELDESLSSRDIINSKLKSILDDATNKWGVKVNRVELQDINPPEDIKEAMEKQMRAERDRRAAVLEAEGEKKSKILEAEGFRESEIKKAEGQKQSEILKAEGEAIARIKISEAEAKAIKIVSEAIDPARKGDSVNYLIATKYIETLEEMVKGKDNKTVYIPFEATSVLSSLGGIKELLKK